jgi:hypothetical protein
MARVGSGRHRVAFEKHVDVFAHPEAVQHAMRPDALVRADREALLRRSRRSSEGRRRRRVRRLRAVATALVDLPENADAPVQFDALCPSPQCTVTERTALRRRSSSDLRQRRARAGERAQHLVQRAASMIRECCRRAASEIDEERFAQS